MNNVGELIYKPMDNSYNIETNPKYSVENLTNHIIFFNIYDNITDRILWKTEDFQYNYLQQYKDNL